MAIVKTELTIINKWYEMKRTLICFSDKNVDYDLFDLW